MELVEGVAGDLPVMLFVHVAQGDCVGEELIEIFDTVGADFFVEADGEFCNFVVGLNLVRLLMEDRARTFGACFGVCVVVGGLAVLGTHSSPSFQSLK